MGRAHFIIADSADMRALADVLTERGWSISSDDDSDLPRGTQWLVYADGTPPTHSARRRAKQLKLPQFSYAQMLGQLVMGRCGVMILGADAPTRGSRGATNLAGRILIDAGIDPTVIDSHSTNEPSRGGHGPVVLLGATCDARLLEHVVPQLAVVGLLDDPRVRQDVSLAALNAWIARVPSDGVVLLRHECEMSQSLARSARADVETYGPDREADWCVAADGAICFRGELVAAAEVVGEHEPFAALAAVAIGTRLGVELTNIARGLGHDGAAHKKAA